MRRSIRRIDELAQRARLQRTHTQREVQVDHGEYSGCTHCCRLMQGLSTRGPEAGAGPQPRNPSFNQGAGPASSQGPSQGASQGAAAAAEGLHSEMVTQQAEDQQAAAQTWKNILGSMKPINCTGHGEPCVIRQVRYFACSWAVRTLCKSHRRRLRLYAHSRVRLACAMPAVCI